MKDDAVISLYGGGKITLSYVNGDEIEVLTETLNGRWVALRLTATEKQELANALTEE